MGRKPNPIIAEFYDRGPKLTDASNRYQHTCKLCRERFPKGRQEVLIGHLVKKCPIIPMDDRRRVALFSVPDLIESRPVPDPNSFAPPGDHDLSAMSGQGFSVTNQNDFAGALAGIEQFTAQEPRLSALETLAEVSRHATDSSLPPFHHLFDAHPSDFGAPHLPSLSATGSSANLALVAASAVNQLHGLSNGAAPATEPSIAATQESINDRFINLLASRVSAKDQLPLSNIDPTLQEDQAQKTSEPAVEESEVRPSHHTSVFQSQPTKDGRAKTRSRFKDARRQEVQFVRKIGACIRCRMLKKPCSDGTPCKTCASVDTARVWKCPCIRGKMTEIIEMYSASLHTVASVHLINQATRIGQFCRARGRLRTSHLESEPMSLSTLQGHNVTSTDIDPALSPGMAQYADFMNLHILDPEADDLDPMMDAYVRRVAPAFIQSEQSEFMRTTLEVALKISRENEDGLLIRALALWTATQILIDLERPWQVIFESPTEPATRDPEWAESNFHRVEISAKTSSFSYELIIAQLAALMEKRCAQLLKNVIHDLEGRLLQRREKTSFSAFLATIIMLNAIERMTWYLKKCDQSVPPPLTARTAENSGFDHESNQLRKSLEDEAAAGEAAAGEAAAEQAATQRRPEAHMDKEAGSPLFPPYDEYSSHAPRNYPDDQPDQPRAVTQSAWFFEKSPATLIEENEHFAELLLIIASKRGIIPKFCFADDGCLDIAPETHQQKRSRSPRSASPGPQDVSREWVSAVRVTRDALERRLERVEKGDGWDEGDVRSCDFKFMGRFLVPGAERVRESR